jgi:hypothetical protein
MPRGVSMDNLTVDYDKAKWAELQRAVIYLSAYRQVLGGMVEPR